MKTTIQTIIIASGFILLSLTANASTFPETTYKTASGKTIHSSLKVPSALGIKNQQVEILFSTDEKGMVNFALAKTSNQLLKKEIEKQFYSMHFSDLKPEMINSVVVNFKTI